MRSGSKRSIICCVVMWVCACDIDAYVGDPLPTLDPCSSPGASWVFCSSFEEQNKRIWDDFDANPDDTTALLEHPGPLGSTANHVMQLRLSAGETGGADLVKVLPGKSARLYARWYVHWQQGGQLSGGAGGLFGGPRARLGAVGVRPRDDDFFQARLVPHDAQQLQLELTYRGMYMQCDAGATECIADYFPCMRDDGQRYCTVAAHRSEQPPPVLEAEHWYCLELMVDAGAPSQQAEGADGGVAFWVDEQPVGSWTNLWLRRTEAATPGILWLSFYSSTAPAEDSGLLLDDVVVGTARVGCR